MPRAAATACAAPSVVGLAALGEKRDDNDEVELLKVIVQSVPDCAELRGGGARTGLGVTQPPADRPAAPVAGRAAIALIRHEEEACEGERDLQRRFLAR